MEQEDEPRAREALASIEPTLIRQKAENKNGLGVGGVGGMGKHKNVGTRAKNGSSSEEVHWKHEKEWGYKGWLR